MALAREICFWSALSAPGSLEEESHMAHNPAAESRTDPSVVGRRENILEAARRSTQEVAAHTLGVEADVHAEPSAVDTRKLAVAARSLVEDILHKQVAGGHKQVAVLHTLQDARAEASAPPPRARAPHSAALNSCNTRSHQCRLAAVVAAPRTSPLERCRSLNSCTPPRLEHT